MDKTKICKGCGQELPLDAFYYKGYGIYFPRCKECEKARLSKYSGVKKKRRQEPEREQVSACIRGYVRGSLHHLYEAAIIKSGKR